MSAQKKLLMVEDSPSLAITYQAYLRYSAYDLEWVDNLSDARLILDTESPDLMLLDVELPDGNGLDLLREISGKPGSPQVVVMTAYGSSDIAEESVLQGAFDYLTKPFNANRLLVTLKNAEKHQELNEKVEAFSSTARSSYCGFIGASIVMQTVYRTIDSLAMSSATAFIMGESGTGKELAAEAIHHQSNRSDKTLYAINCAAIPKDLMESELFGHLKGSFTGATENRDGAVQIANGGTLFLDEICEIDLELQKKLLRFIQSGTFQRVGSNELEEVDVRFVCATNRDPLEEVKAGRFREDLYYRLHVIPVQVPPLRDRDDDILMIAQYFLGEHSKKESKAFRGFSKSVEIVLKNYRWPGNVRELENIIQNVVVLNSGTLVTDEMLPEAIRNSALSGKKEPGSLASSNMSSASIAPAQAYSQIEPLWQVEKDTIQNAIEICGGNVIKAASLLEVAPSTIYRKLQAWAENQSEE